MIREGLVLSPEVFNEEFELFGVRDRAAYDAAVQGRLAALANYRIMDTEEEEAFDEIARQASQVCGSPIATVTFVDDHRQWFKARLGTAVRETPIEEAFCAYTVQRPGELLVVPNALHDQRFAQHVAVVGGLSVRFYAGAPIVTPEGVAIGTVCAVDTEPHEFTAQQAATLASLARQASALLEAARWKAAYLEAQQKVRLLEVSEAYFRHLTEYARDLITILDEDGVIQFESRSIERALGYPQEHYRGRLALDFVHPEDRGTVVAAMGEALSRHGDTQLIRFRFRHRDGSYRLLEGSGNNLLDDPAVRGIVFNSRDVTEHQHLQREIEREREEKEEIVARMTGGVAHDFNNVLAAIQGYAELTALQVSAATQQLANIREATARAANLNQQLLAFSRRLVLEPRALPLVGWLRGLESRLHHHLGSGARVEIDAPFGEVQAWQDAELMEQVLLQLASNAREARPGGVALRLEVAPVLLGPEERPPDGRNSWESYARIIVSDNGCGMPEATLKHIFEPFFTTKASENRHPGLGLSMCRGIIEQSGGHLTVASEVGLGTVIRIFLPVPEVALPPQGELPRGVPPTTARLPAAERATVLLVDDEPMLREIGETVLSEAGYRVIVAEDGPDALLKLTQLGQTPDLLLTDVVMPGMTGVQLAAEVTHRYPRKPILLCSGYTRDALDLKGGLPPGVAFIGKPYTFSSLLEKVRELIGAPVR